MGSDLEMTVNPMKKRIEQQLKVKEYYEHDKQIYFKTLSGSIVYLPRNYYFDRKKNLEEYFLRLYPNDQVKQKRLVLENLGMFGSPLEDLIYHKKVELMSNPSAFVQTWLIKDYPPSEDYSSPTRKELESIRGETLSDESKHLWNSAYSRSEHLWQWLKEYSRKLRKEMGGD